ncbi:hypothetical protein ILYODFUR_031404 [Ilyodon furcidens]|uniref:Uncharacterized protein n=1 Tax=Ilyodon furcidens TaxID=33524 RepID=A0ABV0VB34_9TELE
MNYMERSHLILTGERKNASYGCLEQHVNSTQKNRNTYFLSLWVIEFSSLSGWGDFTIHCRYPLILARSWVYHGAIGRVHPGQVTSPSQSRHFTRKNIVSSEKHT